jgi:ferric-dicitrate binding protein FerR (iron transport regulator)
MDGSLRPGLAQRLRRHMDACPACSEAYQRMVQTQELCREMNQDEPDSVSWKKVEAQLHWKLSREGKEAAKSRQPARNPRVLALAGTTVLGVLVGLFLLSPLVSRLGDDGCTTPVTQQRLVLTAPVENEELAAVVTKLRGKAEVLSTRGELAPLDLNRPLLQGDRAMTDRRSVLALQWEAETGLRLVPNSRVHLRALRTKTQVLSLEQGKLYTHVGKRKPGHGFFVVAGGVRVVVKGTHLSVGMDRDAVEVAVYEGLVRVEPVDNTWDGIDVPAGFHVVVPSGANSTPKLVMNSTSPGVSLINLQPWESFQRVMATTGQLPVRSRPSGLELRLDSEPVGTTNIVLRSPYRSRLLELYKDGKQVLRQWIDFQPNLSGRVVNLKPVILPEVTLLSPRILATIRRNTQRQAAPMIRPCYERRLKTNPRLEGELFLQLTVNGKGRVVRASPGRKTTIRDAYVVRCAVNKALRWTFPPRKTGRYTFSLKFNLSPK